ncbi:response regulator transcription factor [Ponticoccus sp. (in: a-proteobacteria)]|uniref:response regulator transcription factor n=1 Tax=Ponticoccus sp. (in: a-proteobacteria) TaxID=1925025 RepID=UPI003AB36ED0
MAKILILEDDTVFAGLVRRDLEAFGHTVSLAATGHEALELVIAEAFDAAIVDVYIKVDGRLTSDGGVLFISRLRTLLAETRNATRTDIPVLAISGAARAGMPYDILGTTRKLGADDVLPKPFAPQVLREKLDALLSGQGGDGGAP